MIPTIQTRSPIRAWFLSTFFGLRVDHRLKRPVCLLLGATLYSTTTWVLTTG